MNTDLTSPLCTVRPGSGGGIKALGVGLCHVRSALAWQRASASLSVCFLSVFGTRLGVRGFTGCIEPNQAPSAALEIWLNLKKLNTSGIAAQPRCLSTHCGPAVSVFSAVRPFVAWCLHFSQLSFLCQVFFCQTKRCDKSSNMRLSEGHKKEFRGIASVKIQPVTRKQATVCHQTFGILSGSSDMFHQGQPVIPCNFPPQAHGASSLFLLLAKLNTCGVRLGLLLVQKARVSLWDGDQARVKLTGWISEARRYRVFSASRGDPMCHLTCARVHHR